MRIEVRNLSVELEERVILHNITAKFIGPGLYFILGRNGSGKSTLLKAFAGLIPYRGSIRINGKEVREYSRKELARIVAFVWQNPLYGFFESTVEREIRFILKNLEMKRSRFEEFVDYFGIRHLLPRSPFTLSGGEAKRVSLCSVLVADQAIWLLDEPESELDYSGLSKLVKLIEHESLRKLIIVASHNTLFAYKLRRVMKRCLVLDAGRLVREDSPRILEDDSFLESVGVVPIKWWLL